MFGINTETFKRMLGLLRTIPDEHMIEKMQCAWQKEQEYY